MASEIDQPDWNPLQEVVADALMQAAQEGFHPQEGDVTKLEAIRAAAIVVRFLKEMQNGHELTRSALPEDWIGAIETLKMDLGR